MKHPYPSLLSLLIVVALLPTWPTAPGSIQARFQPSAQVSAASRASTTDQSNKSAIEKVNSIEGYINAIGTNGTIAYLVGPSGLAILDVRNPAQPTRLGSLSLPIPTYAKLSVFRAGAMLYITSLHTPLLIVDVSDSLRPRLITSYYAAPESDFMGVWVVGNRAYISGSQFSILDVTDPTKPVLIGSYPVRSDNVQVVDNLAYLDYTILDVSDPAHIVVRSQNPLFFSNYVVGSIAYAVVPTKVVINESDCEEQQLRIFDTSNPNNPRARGSLILPGKRSCAKYMRVDNNFAYIIDTVLGGLTIVDVSNPDQPVLRGSYSAFLGKDLRIVDDRVYIAAGASGLQIIDVSNPAQPTLLGIYAQDTYNIQVLGNLAYMVDGKYGLRILDVANPLNPTLRGRADTPGSANSIQVSGDLAYIADGDSGLQIFNVGNPAAPFVVGSTDTSGSAFELQVVAKIAYILAGSNLQIIDVSQPAAPILRGKIAASPDEYLSSFQVVGNLLYLASNIRFQIFDLSDLDAPLLLYTENSSGHHIQITNGFAYLHRINIEPGRSDYLRILDVRDPAHPIWKRDLVVASISDLKIIGHLLYASAFEGVAIYDISDPENPLPLGWISDVLEFVDRHYDCGELDVVDTMIYIATCPGLTILRVHPDLFQAQTQLTPAGGSLITYDKSLSLTFPANSVAVTTTVTHNGLFTSSQPPYAGRGALRSFTLEATDSNFSSLIQTAQPYTMVISYTDSALKSLGIADENSLNLARWNGAAWVNMLPCAGCTLDTQNNRLTVRTNRFAEFVLSGARRVMFVPLIRR